MNHRFGYGHILIAMLIAALAQLACSFGAQTSTPATQQALSSTSQPAPASTSGTFEHGTGKEAQAMLQKAVAHYTTVGRKQALADFTNRAAPFYDRDLYVACIDSKLIQSANGGFPSLVGSSVEPLSKAAWDAASRTQIASIDYIWLNPVSKVNEGKTFYYEKVGDEVCGVGAYHP